MSQNTIGYFLNQLPDGIREKAINNAVKQNSVGFLDYSSPRITSVALAVKGTFNWKESPEGEDFWLNVYLDSPGYEPPKPVHPMLALLEAFAGFAELLEIVGSVEAAQEKQKDSQTSNEVVQEKQTDSQTSNEVVQPTTETKPKSVRAALGRVLGELGIDISQKLVYSDSRKQGVSVKICGLYVKEDVKQKVKEKMEALGYTYHKIGVPSNNYGGVYKNGAFKGTRFHFS